MQRQTRYILAISLAVVVIFGLGYLLYWLPYFEMDSQDPEGRIGIDRRFDLIGNSRRAFGQALGGLVLFISFLVGIWKVGLTRRGQITDRFIRASEQLGSEKEAVRLAGVYALGRAARPSGS